jgi:hypothetical protein
MDISSGLATDLAANSRLDASNTASNTFFTLVNKQKFQKVPFSTDLASVEPIDDPTTVEIDTEETSAKRVSTLPLTDNPIDSLSNTSKQKTVHVASFGQQQTPPTSPERLKASGYRQPLPFGCFCYGCLMFCYWFFLVARDRNLAETTITLGRYHLEGEQPTVFVFVPAAFLHQNGHGTQPALSFAEVVQRIGTVIRLIDVVQLHTSDEYRETNQ